MKLKLPNVSLLLIDCFNYALAISSIRKSMDKVDFGEVLFLTDIDMEEKGVTVKKIKSIRSKDEYSQFLLKQASKYINTDFVIVAQHDSWVLNPECFDERLYDYDYAGALWLENDGLANGNGGLSWRSKKLMVIVTLDNFINSLLPEDVSICRVYRNYLEINYGLKWATDEICEQFSFELRKPIQKTFAFHSYFHKPFQEHIVLKRTAAMGDLIMLETVIRYYCEKGYQVVLDTLPQFMELFKRYDYYIKHITEMDNRIVPIKSINFDMAYENKPKQLALKSYIELTGENIPLSNSRLNFSVDRSVYLFDKLILIHIDPTSMPYRDVHGVNWNFVVNYYLRLGFQVFQVGKRMKEQVAPYLNTSNIETLMMMISNTDVFVGIDSGLLQIAVSLDVPSVGFFGSVNSDFRYMKSDRLITLHSPCVKKEDDFCYHNDTGSTVGKDCKYNKELPPCTMFSEHEVIKSINKLLNK